jgi:N-acetylglutamate synthase-like GNAT family acetyltransferase
VTKAVIRKGRSADLPAVLQLIRELAAYEKAPAEVEVTLAEMHEWGFGRQKVYDFFVVEKQGHVVAVAVYYFKYSTWKGKCLFLEDLIVTEAERCNGYGTLLMKEILRVANEEKLRRVEWQVLHWNEPAISFYKKFNATFDDEWLNCRLIPSGVKAG